MKLIFLGATQTVTGSKFLIEDGDCNFLVDCGLYQGYKWLRERNWQPQAFDIGRLDAVVLTHAHIDHSGYIPRLYQQGYRGPVYCHRATRDLCGILLPDSGRIQEEDARFYARHKLSKHTHPEPLYDGETAERSMELFQPLDFGQEFSIGNSRVHLQPAGHILGAGSAIVDNNGTRVGFSGDVGRPNDLIMRPPQPLPELDLLLMESTYGNRRHPQVDVHHELARVVNETASHGGVLLIPSFAVGRAQALQYLLVTLMDSGDIPELPIYLDSPMAIDVTDLYCQYADQHRLSPAECQHMHRGIIYTHSVDESKALENIQYPHIIIAGSGMATGGRILHHMKRLLPDHHTTLLFCGYQAGGTRGARLTGGGTTVKIHGEQVPCRAQVEMIEGMSAHADYRELGAWLQQSQMQADTPVQLVHGEPDAADALRFYLKEHTNFHPIVPEYRQVLHL
ncbi:MBL fold metallo-hydrolase [Microbulbifer sp. SAOS-129_SWC]|uniref:MBL fold metallo-hydrolase n=1 Tax=Microbulbifer sp. SAOS-129_SWC TaxID=3145235 RepID=UPI0032168754